MAIRIITVDDQLRPPADATATLLAVKIKIELRRPGLTRRRSLRACSISAGMPMVHLHNICEKAGVAGHLEFVLCAK